MLFRNLVLAAGVLAATSDGERKNQLVVVQDVGAVSVEFGLDLFGAGVTS